MYSEGSDEVGSALDLPSSHFSSLVSRAQARLFRRHPWLALSVVLAAYVAIILAFGRQLGVSSNYFVLLPVMVAALGLGTPGGLVAGLLGLPGNLLLFAILGHPEFSPASKAIAEVSGLLVGFLFGSLSDHFLAIEEEMDRRLGVESKLRKALADKEVLLAELNHRVRNNLNVVKSLVQLQRSRSRDPAFVEASGELLGRLFAISRVHDVLITDSGTLDVDAAGYLSTLASRAAAGAGLDPSRLRLELGEGGSSLPMDTAVHLGLIVNEALTNAIKHAESSGTGMPSLRLRLQPGPELWRLFLEDDGPGIEDGGGAEEGAPEPPPAFEGARQSLGLKIIETLSAYLGGKSVLRPAEGHRGAVFELAFPAPAPRGEEAGRSRPAPFSATRREEGSGSRGT